MIGIILLQNVKLISQTEQIQNSGCQHFEKFSFQEIKFFNKLILIWK